MASVSNYLKYYEASWVARVYEPKDRDLDSNYCRAVIHSETFQ